MINSESKCSSELSIVEQKILPKRSLKFQEHVQHMCAYFMLPPHVKYDNIELILQKYVDKCVICKNTCNTTFSSRCLMCQYGCYEIHDTKPNFFVMCDNCVNLCTNGKKTLIRMIYLCGNDWILTRVYEMYENNGIMIYDNNVINIINDIIASDSIIDRYYNFNSKCTLLIIMSYYDANSFLIKIPKDVVKYMCMNFIYNDR